MICEGRQMLPRLGGGDTLYSIPGSSWRCREREGGRERTSALETYARSIERKECSQTLPCKAFPFCPRLPSSLCRIFRANNNLFATKERVYERTGGSYPVNRMLRKMTDG